MPLRDAIRGERVCDLFYSSVIEPNNADLFVVTDTTDFYYDGVHYFDESRRGQLGDTSSTMFHDVIDFMDREKARGLITAELSSFFRGRAKVIKVQDPVDVSTDQKFVMLSNLASNDSAPRARTTKLKAALVGQYIKIKLAHDLLMEHERLNAVRYDLVFRSRFDNMHGYLPMNLLSFDYGAYDVFVPGFVDDLLVYDWCAFGTRRAMDPALSLYDKLGFTADNRLYRCECKNCGFLRCGDRIECLCKGRMEYEEMTFSSEYHLYRLFKDNNIRYAAAGYPMSPYRYR